MSLTLNDFVSDYQRIIIRIAADKKSPDYNEQLQTRAKAVDQLIKDHYQHIETDCKKWLNYESVAGRNPQPGT